VTLFTTRVNRLVNLIHSLNFKTPKRPKPSGFFFASLKWQRSNGRKGKTEKQKSRKAEKLKAITRSNDGRKN